MFMTTSYLLYKCLLAVFTGVPTSVTDFHVQRLCRIKFHISSLIFNTIRVLNMTRLISFMIDRIFLRSGAWACNPTLKIDF